MPSRRTRLTSAEAGRDHVVDPEGREPGIEVTTGIMSTKTPEQGAATSVLLATSPDLDGTGVASYALDPANADRLWDVSEALLQRA
jgi:hypothetical protein